MSDQFSIKVKDFVLDKYGVKRVLQSDGVSSALQANAGNVGNGVIKQTFVGYDRVHVLVATGEKIAKDTGEKK